jgi:GxxExxY protein
MSELLYKSETYKIIGACMKVHQTLGNGFLESVYQEALEKELQREGIPFQRQKRLNIFYGNEKLDKYFIADFVCYDKIILEIKAVTYLGNNLKQQVVNYLKSTNMEVGLLINFGEKSLTWKRFINTPYSV